MPSSTPFPVVFCLAQLVDSRDVQQMWVLRRFDVSWWQLNLSIPSPMSFKLYAVLVADSTIIFYFCLRMITQYFRHSDSRPYGNYHRWNHFHLVSSKSTICNVIFRQSLCRSVRECLYVICISHARFRWGSVVLLSSYPAGRLIFYLCRGFNSGPSLCVILLNKILAVKHISRPENFSFSSNKSSFAVRTFLWRALYTWINISSYLDSSHLCSLLP